MVINPPYNSLISFALDTYDHSIQGNPFFHQQSIQQVRKRGRMCSLGFCTKRQDHFHRRRDEKVELARLPDQRCTTVAVTERDQPADIMAGPKE